MSDRSILIPGWDTRSLKTIREIRTRNENGDPIIEGYFVSFNGTYTIADGITESIDRHAFDNAIEGKDIRILTDHDTKLVLGRTTAGTAQIRVDDIGVWGHADINPNDADAMNAHARVERGDVSQGSFGFNILAEDTEVRDDGTVHFTIREVELFELSIVTFPAYEDTSIAARAKQAAGVIQRERQTWREKMKRRLSDGIKSTDEAQGAE